MANLFATLIRIAAAGPDWARAAAGAVCRRIVHRKIRVAYRLLGAEDTRVVQMGLKLLTAVRPFARPDLTGRHVVGRSPRPA
jgi:hypothetical protein